MKIIVTGASGLFGSKLVELATKRNHEVYSCYSSHRINIGYPVKLNVLDRNSVLEVFSRVRPEVVVHAAALTDVDLCEKDKNLAFNINVEGTRNVVEACKKVNAYLVYISTDYVFSGDKGNYKEEDECNPINYYGYTKLEGEKIVKLSNLEYLIARTSVIYGSKPAAGKINFALWVLERLRSKKEVPALVDQFVSPTLNTNLAEMIIESIDKKLTGVYHMSGASRVSRYNFAVKIAEAFNLDGSLVKESNMNKMNWIAKRPRDSSLNVEKTISRLKNKPLNIDEAIRRFKEEIKENA